MSEQKTAYQIVEERCRRQQIWINDTIALQCKDASPFQWETLAEDVITRYLGDEFEYIWVTAFGQPPQIAISRYRNLVEGNEYYDPAGDGVYP